jgi:hypothetical protein
MWGSRPQDPTEPFKSATKGLRLQPTYRIDSNGVEYIGLVATRQSTPQESLGAVASTTKQDQSPTFIPLAQTVGKDDSEVYRVNLLESYFVSDFLGTGKEGGATFAPSAGLIGALNSIKGPSLERPRTP